MRNETDFESDMARGAAGRTSLHGGRRRFCTPSAAGAAIPHHGARFSVSLITYHRVRVQPDRLSA